jgi:mannose-6-phosphate isomerase-like protein (cupin superfamily)
MSTYIPIIRKYNAIDDTIIVSPTDVRELYDYKVYIGTHDIKSKWTIWVADNFSCSKVYTRRDRARTTLLGIVVPGYKSWNRDSSINVLPSLPYINGCATSQLLPPIRSGDPTWQYLYMPPHTAEQAHHIHSTARIVYVKSGSGICIHGTPTKTETIALEPHDVLIIDPMVPHHFKTGGEPLEVLPFHVWSSQGRSEFNHPMFNGTHEV